MSILYEKYPILIQIQYSTMTLFSTDLEYGQGNGPSLVTVVPQGYATQFLS